MEKGNPIERNLAPFFNNRFQNYIKYRRFYLVPLTGFPEDPNWRFDTHPYLEHIGIASYGLLKSINYIYIKQNQIKVGDPEQTFKNIYFHFGHISDCIEVLARSIVLVLDLVGIKKLNKSMKVSEETLLKEFKEWIETKYDEKYSQMIQFGRPIFYYPQQEHNYLSTLATPSQRKGYNSFIMAIKDYRNFYVHNPGVDVILEIPTQRKYVLRKEYVNLARNWATIRNVFNSKRSCFVDPEIMVTSDLNELIELLNDLWLPIMKCMESIYSSPNFNIYFKDFDRNSNQII